MWEGLSVREVNVGRFVGKGGECGQVSVFILIIPLVSHTY